MSEPVEIIFRCTRNGVTSWQNVAAQLGRSVDSVRREFDPQYLHVRPWPHRCEPVEPEVDVESMRSPYVRGPGLRAEIIAVLARGSESAEIIAVRLGRPVNSIRARLDRMMADKLVRHDGRFPRTWALTDLGMRVHVTGCEIRGTSAP